MFHKFHTASLPGRAQAGPGKPKLLIVTAAGRPGRAQASNGLRDPIRNDFDVSGLLGRDQASNGPQPKLRNGPRDVQRTDFRVGGPAWKGPGSKMGLGMLKGTTLTWAGLLGKAQASKHATGISKNELDAGGLGRASASKRAPGI